MDVPAPSSRAGCSGSIGSPLDDPYGAAAMMNFDGYSELCSSPSLTDQLFSLLNDSSTHQMFAMWSSLGSSPRAPGISEDMQLDSFSSGPGLQKTDLEPLANPAETGRVAKSSGELGSVGDLQQGSTSLVPRPVAGNLLAERMLMALNLFRQSLGGGVLAQVWMPVEQEGHVVLSTCEQPFLLDQALAGYREISRQFVFSAKEETSLYPGVPGRVFISGVPEWTSNVLYYSKPEYLRMEYAVRHDVRGSLAMPIYDPSKGSCCAVLELITKNEKPDFDAEMDNLRQALQAVNLNTTRDCSNGKFYSENQKAAFTEILDVLRAICHAHMLPLALTWVPTSDGSSDGHVVEQESVFDSRSGKAMLSIHKSACYVNDAKMQGFFHACAESHLEKGQGIVGRALKSNLPFFSPNIREYSIKDYPLAHHARKFGLHAAVAIRLRSTYTGDDDYILEFFLPVNCTGSEEQQLLLNNLSSTMQRICKSLRTVSEAEVVKVDACTTLMYKTTSGSCLPAGHSESSSHCDQPVTEKAFQDLSLVDKHGDTAEQSSSARLAEKRRSTAEKNIGIDVLRKYFSGSLKDAAKSLGVCPTTLKRICRQHGISRWPSRKINKVNRSLKKIQTVINSVHGVDSSLQYDPASGSLVPAVSMPEKMPFPSSDALSSPSVGKSTDEKSGPKSEQGYSSPEGWERENCQLELPDARKGEGNEFHMQTRNYSGSDNHASYDAIVTDHLNSEGTQGPLYPTAVVGSLHHKEPGYINHSVSVCPGFGTIEDQIAGRNSPPIQPADIDMFGDHGDREHTHPSTSGMTDSSSGSASSHPTFKKNPSHSLKDKSSPALTVKATYNGDTVRFKFMPSLGWYHLLDEIAKRFKLSTGVFQLKYKDDEDEWVIMANESDLQECVDVMDSMGTHNVKLQVRDLPCLISSSGSSTCLQLEGQNS
ncbi:protein NLP2 [Lolium perenne]|uniref:protein NLP2 n=1 Tax=Lolium perenne TaxID=4522 RepID=UPI0021F61583|nr:protein NLP2-like [Lolium perenne]